LTLAGDERQHGLAAPDLDVGVGGRRVKDALGCKPFDRGCHDEVLKITEGARQQAQEGHAEQEDARS
jgi:hypothetical protein